MSRAEEFESLHRSDQRVVRSVDSLTDEEWGQPSLLPGWNRAHVVAHLALNAEGFANALEGLAELRPVAIYRSGQARDDDIAELAAAPTAEIRAHFFAATERFRRIAEDLPEPHWSGIVLRTPDGPEWPVAGLIAARQREVEIHHADLGVEYTHVDWPADFTTALLERVAPSQDFTITTTDGRSWNQGAPTVTGPAADLAWWLIGRGAGEALLSDGGVLPALGPWQGPPR